MNNISHSNNNYFCSDFVNTKSKSSQTSKKSRCICLKRDRQQYLISTALLSLVKTTATLTDLVKMSQLSLDLSKKNKYNQKKDVVTPTKVQEQCLVDIPKNNIENNVSMNEFEHIETIPMNEVEHNETVPIDGWDIIDDFILQWNLTD